MNRITSWLCLALLLLAAACNKDDNEPAKEPLTVSKTSVNLQGYSGYTDSFTIEYPGNWTITMNPMASWLNISSTSGSGNATIYITAAQHNTTGTGRSAALAVIPDGDESRKANITVIQSTFTSMVWSRIFGGSLYDVFKVILPTPEGGYIAAGYVESMDGDVTGNHGGQDVWVVKMDGVGAVVWKKAYGGTDADRAQAMVPANDGGYIIVGCTRSKNGDVTNHKYSEDVWIMKIDGNGNLVWQKTYGGYGSEEAFSIVSTNDGGYMIGAHTDSRDGDVTGQHSDPTTLHVTDDVWLLKIDVSGNLQWQKTYGGKWGEVCHSITKTADGGYVAAGYSNATTADGDVQPTRGGNDMWAFKIDANGNLQWQKTYGGSRNDYARKVLAVTDGYILSGGTESNDGQVTGNHGSMDAWIVKVDMSGNLVWQRAFGGMYFENAWHLVRDGNDFVFSADVESNDGDLVGNTDSDASWIVKIDANGNKIWHKIFGGSHDDDPGMWILVNPDKSYTVAAVTRSNNGDVPPGNHGFFDAWVFTFRY